MLLLDTFTFICNTKDNSEATIFLAALLLHLCLVLPARAAELTIQPYLLKPGTTVMTVQWESDTLAEGTVIFRQDTKAPRVVTVKEPVKTPVGYEAPPYLYAATLTDLTPSTRYTYSVKSGDIVSKPGYFTTFAEKPDSFTFIAYGDSRSNPDIHKKVGANFSRHNPQFILHSGDFVMNGTNRGSWRTDLFEPLEDVINHIPLFAAYGNHERDGVMLAFYFSLPSSKRLYYSFDYGNAHFNFLRSTKVDELAWLDKDLAATKATWKFAIYHYPSFNIGGHGAKWGQGNLVPLFRKHKLDVSITGHSHLYERFYPLVPLDEPKAHPVTYIVSGGGGAPKYRAGSNPALAKSKSMSHFLVVKVRPESITVEVREIDDTLFDTFTINKKDGHYDKAYLASAMPEELVKLDKILYGNAKGKWSKLDFHLSKLPQPGQPGQVVYNYSGPDFDRPFKGVITLSKESQANYTMEPAEMPFSILNAEKSKGSFRLLAKGQLKMKKGHITPPLSVIYRVKIGTTKMAKPKTVSLKLRQ